MDKDVLRIIMKTDRIAKLDLRSMRNDAHFQFHTEFRDLVAESGAEALGVAALFDAYLPLYDREDTALTRTVKSALPEQIREADARRNETFGAMMFINLGMRKHFDPVAREAASRLHDVLRAYGNLSRKTLSEQTAAVGGLLRELRREKYRADLVLARMNDWVDELEARNDALDALMTAHNEETASPTDIDKALARTALDAAYRLIRARINAHAGTANGAESYKSFVNALNKIVKKYASTRWHRKH